MTLQNGKPGHSKSLQHMRYTDASGTRADDKDIEFFFSH